MYELPPDPHPLSEREAYWLRWALELAWIGLTVYFFFFWMLWLLDGHTFIWIVPTLLASVFTARGAVKLVDWLYRSLRRRARGQIVFAGVLLAAAWIGWIAFPVSCATYKLAIQPPNKRCDCRGLTVNVSLGGITDYGSADYCIGQEIF